MEPGSPQLYKMRSKETQAAYRNAVTINSDATLSLPFL